jgi:hypothetical protein
MVKLNYHKLMNSLDFANYVVINYNLKMTKLSVDEEHSDFTTVEFDMPN